MVKAFGVVHMHVPLEVDYSDQEEVEKARQDLVDAFAPTAERLGCVARIEILPNRTETRHA